MAITKVINDAVDLNQASDYSGLRLPVGTTGDVVESFTTDYLVVGGGGGGGEGYYGGGGGAGGLRTSYNNSTTTTNSLSFPSGKTAIATYMLDNNANDVSGNYNGTETNITYNTGKYGGGAVFNGSSSYIDTGQINFGANNISVSLWVHPNASQIAYANIIDYDHSSSGGWTIQQDNTSTNSYKISVKNGSSYNASSAFSLTSNQWNHIVFTVTSAGAYSIYVDNGTPITGTGLTGLSTSTNNNLNIGRWHSGASRYWGGSIDQVRIYNVALSATDVSNIYNNETQANSGGGTAAESSLTLTAGVAYDVTVGSGAVGGNTQSGTADNGNNSIFSTITSNGGGGGQNRAGSFGSNGGSGGGASLPSDAGGNGTLNQGYAGGSLPALMYGAGGGGASEIGLIPLTNYNQSPQRNSLGAPGGDGLSVSITGTATYYSGGGGGGARDPGPDSGTNGGLGGGGAGGKFAIGDNGFSNTGGGGGGGGDDGDNGGDGGSGVVILRYPTASVSSFTTTGTLNTPSTTDTLADNNYPVTNLAYYKLDGDAADSSGNGYNGAESNVTWQNGRFNQAAVFNGSSSYIDTGISSLGANFSVSMWINEDVLSSGGFFGNWNATSNDDMFWLTQSDGSLRINIDGTSNQYFGSAGDVTINTWHHIVVSFNSGTYEVYLDSNSLGTATTSNTVFSSGASFFIGKDAAYSPAYFNGKIDQVRIYSTALTSSQVTELYEEHYQTQFTDGSNTAIVFTEGTGTVTFSGVDPAPPQGALRTNTSYSEDGSASVIEHYNGTDWKYFDAIKYCTTNTLNFPSGAGCIASYNLDNNVNDIGNTYNGVNSNVTFNASGKFGAAAVFNGSNSAIVIPNNILASNNHSLSIWFYLNDTNGIQTLIEFDYGNRIIFRVASTDSNWAYIGNSGYFNPGITYNAGQWYNVVITFSNGNPFKIYVNGNLSYTGGNTNLYLRTVDNIIGAGNSSGGNSVDGKIDQIRLFNQELSSAEVSKLYNNEIACS